jgi:antitoxin VapB
VRIAKLFKNGQSQAVRLPKDFRFEGTEVFAKKSHNAVVLIAKDNPWENFFQSLDQFSEDFMSERHQPPPQKREDL